MTDWGCRALDLYYAGCHIGIRGLSEAQHETLSDRYQALATAGRDDRVPVAARAIRAQVPEEDPSRYAHNGIYTPELDFGAEHSTMAGEYFRAQVDHSSPLRARLLTGSEAHLSRKEVFENFLRVVAAYTSLQLGGLFLHSAGIVFDGCAWLFLGRSGAGKSTLSALALEGGGTIMSDDCNILRPRPGGDYEVSPVPFAGDLGSHANYTGPAYPLGGLFWLQQSPGSGLEAVSSGNQLARLMACCPVVNVDPYRLDDLVSTCTQLLAKLPMQALNFRRDDSFAALQQLIMETNRVSA